MTFEAGKTGPRWLEVLAPCRDSRALAARIAILPVLLAMGGCISDPFLGAQQGGEATASTESSANPPAGTDAVMAATESGPSPVISMVPTQVLQPAPEVFLSEEWALWDGQRTMGGRWVALPDVAYSTRVRITSIDTGTSTDGALVLRDPGLAGPRLMISSDAAEALGLRPGVAVTVELVALRFADVPETPAGDSPAGESATAGDAGVVDSADAGQQGPLPLARPVRQSAARGTPQKAAAVQEPRPAPAPAVPAAAPSAEVPDVSPTDDSANTPAIAPADIRGAAAPAETRGAAAPVAVGAITDGLSYIQAGIFGDPTNATRLIGRLQAAGLSANAVMLQRGSRKLTRVLVGPFDNIEARDQALSKVRRIGPEDAIPVRD